MVLAMHIMVVMEFKNCFLPRPHPSEREGLITACVHYLKFLPGWPQWPGCMSGAGILGMGTWAVYRGDPGQCSELALQISVSRFISIFLIVLECMQIISSNN